MVGETREQFLDRVKRQRAYYEHELGDPALSPNTVFTADRLRVEEGRQPSSIGAVSRAVYFATRGLRRQPEVPQELEGMFALGQDSPVSRLRREQRAREGPGGSEFELGIQPRYRRPLTPEERATSQLRGGGASGVQPAVPFEAFPQVEQEAALLRQRARDTGASVANVVPLREVAGAVRDAAVRVGQTPLPSTRPEGATLGELTGTFAQDLISGRRGLDSILKAASGGNVTLDSLGLGEDDLTFVENAIIEAAAPVNVVPGLVGAKGVAALRARAAAEGTSRSSSLALRTVANVVEPFGEAGFVRELAADVAFQSAAEGARRVGAPGPVQLAAGFGAGAAGGYSPELARGLGGAFRRSGVDPQTLDEALRPIRGGSELPPASPEVRAARENLAATGWREVDISNAGPGTAVWIAPDGAALIKGGATHAEAAVDAGYIARSAQLLADPRDTTDIDTLLALGWVRRAEPFTYDVWNLDSPRTRALVEDALISDSRARLRRGATDPAMLVRVRDNSSGQLYSAPVRDFIESFSLRETLRSPRASVTRSEVATRPDITPLTSIGGGATRGLDEGPVQGGLPGFAPDRPTFRPENVPTEQQGRLLDAAPQQARPTPAEQGELTAASDPRGVLRRAPREVSIDERQAAARQLNVRSNGARVNRPVSIDEAMRFEPVNPNMDGNAAALFAQIVEERGQEYALAVGRAGFMLQGGFGARPLSVEDVNRALGALEPPRIGGGAAAGATRVNEGALVRVADPEDASFIDRRGRYVNMEGGVATDHGATARRALGDANLTDEEAIDAMAREGFIRLDVFGDDVNVDVRYARPSDEQLRAIGAAARGRSITYDLLAPDGSMRGTTGATLADFRRALDETFPRIGGGAVDAEALAARIPREQQLPPARITTRPELFQARNVQAGEAVDPRRVRQITEGFVPERFQPIDVVRDPDNPGDFIVFAGHHRLEAARQLGLENVPARVHVADIADPQARSALQNEAALSNFLVAPNALDEQFRAFSMLRQNGMSVEDIAANTRQTVGHVERVLDIGDAGPELLEGALRNRQLFDIAAEVGRGRRLYNFDAETAGGLFRSLTQGGRDSLPTATAVRRQLDTFGRMLEGRQGALGFALEGGGRLAGFEESAGVLGAMRRAAELRTQLEREVRRLAADVKAAERLGERVEMPVAELLRRGEESLTALRSQLDDLEETVAAEIRAARTTDAGEVVRAAEEITAGPLPGQAGLGSLGGDVPRETLDAPQPSTGAASASTPAARSSSSVSSTPAITSETVSPSASRQPAPAVQRSTRAEGLSPSSAYKRSTTPPSRTGPISTNPIVTDPERPALHEWDDLDVILANARNAHAPYDADLRAIGGERYIGSRVKQPGRIGEKLEGRSPSQVSDYLGGRLAIADEAQGQRFLDQLVEGRPGFEVVADDGRIVDRPGGYRARHVQVKLPNGVSAELQLVPDRIAAAQGVAHRFYEDVRHVVPDPETGLLAPWDLVRVRRADKAMRYLFENAPEGLTPAELRALSLADFDGSTMPEALREVYQRAVEINAGPPSALALRETPDPVAALRRGDASAVLDSHAMRPELGQRPLLPDDAERIVGDRGVQPPLGGPPEPPGPPAPPGRGGSGNGFSQPDVPFERSVLPDEDYADAAMRQYEGALGVGSREVQRELDGLNDQLVELGLGRLDPGSGRIVVERTPELDELWRALHAPSAVERGELVVPERLRALYDRLREVQDWETAASLDFDPQFATRDDYFYRGWRSPEGMFTQQPGTGGAVGATPGFRKPRSRATWDEMRALGFEPISWNPAEQLSLRRIAGEEYRAQVTLINRLRSQRVAVAVDGPVPQGWRVPRVGPAFEGKRYGRADGSIGTTQAFMVPVKLADLLEEMFDAPLNLGTARVFGREFDIFRALRGAGWSVKRAKLAFSFFQQIDFATRTTMAMWGAALDDVKLAMRTGDVRGLLSAADRIYRVPQSIAGLVQANLSPGTRRSLRDQLLDSGPWFADRPGITPRGILEAGWSPEDFTIRARSIRRDVQRALDDLSGTERATAAVIGRVRQIERAMQNGLFDGVYPAAQVTALRNFIVPSLIRKHPDWTDRQIMGQAALDVNKMFSTLLRMQSNIPSRGLREISRTLMFSTNETESLLQQAFSTVRGRNKSMWIEYYLGGALALGLTAEIVNYAATGEHLPLDRLSPIQRSPFSDTGWAYNTRFFAPELPWVTGRAGLPLSLDLMGQMDTVFGLLDPVGFLSARTAPIPRALGNQIAGEDFYERPLDDPLERVLQLGSDLFGSIGLENVRGAMREAGVPGVTQTTPENEGRLGVIGQLLQAPGPNLRATSNDELRDIAAGEFREGARFDDLEPLEQRRALEPYEEELERRRATAEERGDPFAQRRGRIADVDEERLRREFALGEAIKAGTVRGRAIREQYDEIQRDAIMQRAGIDRVYADQLGERTMPDDPNELALFRYREAYRESETALGLDHDLLNARLAALERTLTPEQLAYIERNTGLSEHDPGVEELVRTKRELNEWEFHDIPDAAWGYVVQRAQGSSFAESVQGYDSYYDWRDDLITRAAQSFEAQGQLRANALAEAERRVAQHPVASMFGQVKQYAERQFISQAPPDLVERAAFYGYLSLDKTERGVLEQLAGAPQPSVP